MHSRVSEIPELNAFAISPGAEAAVGVNGK